MAMEARGPPRAGGMDELHELEHVEHVIIRSKDAPLVFIHFSKFFCYRAVKKKGGDSWDRGVKMQ